jgi:L-fuconolactonase
VTIDAHVHLWDRRLDPQDWIDPVAMAPIDRDFGTPELVAMLDEAGIDRAIVVQASNSAGETGRLLALEEPRIAGVVGWVDLAADVRAQLRGFGATGRRLVGIRHLVHVDADPAWLARPDVGTGLDALAEAGLGFDLVLRSGQLPLAERAAREHPATRFVLDHLGGVAETDDPDGWERGIRALAERPNVVAKISGLWRAAARPAELARVVGVAVDAFGPDRLMYGSDWPLVRMGGGAAAWRSAVETALAGLSPAEREQVFAGTAVRHYGLVSA